MNKKSTFLNTNRRILLMVVAILTAVINACAGVGGIVTASEEESGNELALDERYDKVRNGARLVLTYDLKNNSFSGFVENVTDFTLKQVRVEVHLSNGVELGPPTQTDLDPGESVEINLTAPNKDFDGWTAHPEVGESISGEHEHGEGDNEYGEEGESGHGEE
jgi:hypothetical protein